MPNKLLHDAPIMSGMAHGGAWPGSHQGLAPRPGDDTGIIPVASRSVKCLIATGDQQAAELMLARAPNVCQKRKGKERGRRNMMRMACGPCQLQRTALHLVSRG